MNNLIITLNEDGSVKHFAPDFKIIRGSYRSVLINIEVPKSLLLDIATDDTGQIVTGNNVRIASIIHTATGQNIQTQRYELKWIKDYTLNGIEYCLYQRKMPKEFTLWETYNALEMSKSGNLEMVINVVNWAKDDGTTKIEEVVSSNIIPLTIYPGAFLENAEEITEPSDFDELQSQVQDINSLVNNINDDLYNSLQYLLQRLKAGNKITIEKDTSVVSNKVVISVQTTNADEVPIEKIGDLNAGNVQEALQLLSLRKDDAWSDLIPLLFDDISNVRIKTGDAIKNIVLDEETGILTITRTNGKKFIIDLPLESLVKSGYYNSSTKEIMLVLENGNTLKIPVADLVNEYYADNTTLTMYTDTNDGNKIKFKISDTYKSKIDANTSNRHSHSNKTLLDTYNQTNANLTDAVSKKHTHSNSGVLNATTASYTTQKDTALTQALADIEELQENASTSGTVIYDNGNALETFNLEEIVYSAISCIANNAEYANRCTKGGEIDRRLKALENK